MLKEINIFIFIFKSYHQLGLLVCFSEADTFNITETSRFITDKLSILLVEDMKKFKNIYISTFP